MVLPRYKKSICVESLTAACSVLSGSQKPKKISDINRKGTETLQKTSFRWFIQILCVHGLSTLGNSSVCISGYTRDGISKGNWNYEGDGGAPLWGETKKALQSADRRVGVILWIGFIKITKVHQMNIHIPKQQQQQLHTEITCTCFQPE